MPAQNFSWSKSNRSQSSLGSIPHPPSSGSLAHDDPDAQQYYRVPQQQQQQQQYRREQVTRTHSQSQRYSSGHQFELPPVNVAASVHAAEERSNYDRRYEQQQQQQQHSFPGPPSQRLSQSLENKKSIRSFFSFGHSSRDSVDKSQHNSNKLGRKASVRRSGAPSNLSVEEQQRLQGWPSRTSSKQNLPPSPQIDEDSNYDPFLIRNEHASPIEPQRDSPIEFYTQQAPRNHYSQQPQPPLVRVNTGHSYSPQGGAEQFYQEGQDLAPHQLPQVQAYPEQQRQQHTLQQPPQYQAYHTPLHSPIPQHAPGVQAQSSPQQQENAHYVHAGQSPPHLQYQHPQYNQTQQADQAPYRPSLEQQRSETGRFPVQQLQQQQFQEPQPSPQVEYQRPASPEQDEDEDEELQTPNSQQPVAVRLEQAGAQVAQAEREGAPDTVTERMAQRKSVQLGESNPHNMPPTHRREESNLQQQGQGQVRSLSPGLAAYNADLVPQQSQGQPFRGGHNQSHSQGQVQSQQDVEMGRGTPPPRSAIEGNEGDLATQHRELQQEYKTLREKYQKVKKYYFDKDAHVTTLQNTLANQRMTLSRTSLDDTEYGARFTRLDGLISQLAFSIRKSWKTIPAWLHPGVNKDAVVTGKQEMTAVGKAVMSMWLLDEIFETYFHPDLDKDLSRTLRSCQSTVRRCAPPFHSGEEEEALHARIVSWRLTTLEGLQDALRSPSAADRRRELTQELSEDLVREMSSHLQDPAPPDLAGGVSMVVELAVNIAAHLPCESRDVQIDYFLPGTRVNEEMMKVETGIPPLTNPISDSLLNDNAEKADRASVRSTASDMAAKDSTTSSAEEVTPSSAGTMSETKSPPPPMSAGKEAEKSSRRGMFSGLMGSKKPVPSQGQQKQVGAGGSQSSLSAQPQQQPPPPPKEDRVRFSVGLCVAVRGKSVLKQASVYAL